MKRYISPWIVLATLAIIGLIVAVFLVPVRKEENAAISKAMIAKVSKSSSESYSTDSSLRAVASASASAQMVPVVESTFCGEKIDRKNFVAILYAVDYDLKEVSKAEKGNPCGSLSAFIGLIHDALQEGAPKKEVAKRVDELILLAKGGKFLDRYEKYLFSNGDEKSLRGYINATLRALKVPK